VPLRDRIKENYQSLDQEREKLISHIPQFHYESINTLSFKENNSKYFQLST
jgi:hypothetical protein